MVTGGPSGSNAMSEGKGRMEVCEVRSKSHTALQPVEGVSSVKLLEGFI